MALTPGTRLGVYEIVGQIGAGGMGEVYRATDPTLDRQVAIKILPEAFAADPDRVARFEREAKTLASLNHPNIAAIYGFEKSAGLLAIVMELVEGPTLAEVIAAKNVAASGKSLRSTAPSEGEAQQAVGVGPHGISIDEAVPIAKQIADALEAAHDQARVHRDLKPANIKLRADGMVKVLDFGLAKAMEPSVAADVTNSPTLSLAATRAGVILGTAAYMSPEQARGKAVDKRADIWAFGAVLFEMLTGRRAFGADDLTDTIVSVVSKEPDWAALPPSTPVPVRSLLRRCLDKDPKRRLRDIGEARLALEGAFETAVPQTTAPATASAPRAGWAWTVAAVAVLAAAALAIPTVRHIRETVPLETRVDIVTPATDQPASFALSPDGREIAYVASGDAASRLWLRSLAATTAQPLAGTEGATYPFWSPDGQSIGFFAESALKRIDLGGGAPRTIAPARNGAGGSWSADGVIVFAPSRTSPLMRVSATGGAATAATTLGPQQSGHRFPHFLPDGRRLLFFGIGAPDTTGIYLGGLDGSAPTRLTPADNNNDIARVSLLAGWLLWVRAGTLVAQRLDVAKAVLTGEPVTLADDVLAVEVAAAGLVAYRTGVATTRQLVWFDRSGTPRGTVGDADVSSLSNPRVSPDGRRVVVTRTVQGNQDLWLLDGTRMSRFTIDAASDQFAEWSPDGTRIAFRSRRTGAGDLYQKLTSGVGVDERLITSDQPKAPSSWSPDGRFLLHISTDPQTGTADQWLMPTEGDRTPSVFLKTPFRETAGKFSPNGLWVAYQSDESGRLEIYVRPFVPPGAAGATAVGVQHLVSSSGGISPAWRPDGKELYYLNPAGAMMAVPITVRGATLEPGAPLLLFPTQIVGGGVDAQQGRQYDVAPNGRFLINTELDSAAAPITLLQNWNPAAKK